MIDRIADRATFAALAGGRRARCGPVRVRFVNDRAGARPNVRVAFALNRRTGSAVTRNRIRRRLRAALAELDRGAAGLPAGAYLFSAEPGARAVPFDELVRSVSGAVQRVTTESDDTTPPEQRGG